MYTSSFFLVSLLFLHVHGGATWKVPHKTFDNIQLPHGHQVPLSAENDDDLNIYGATSFAGLRTFANLPFVDCFSDENAEGHKYDIAVFEPSFDPQSRLPLAGRELALVHLPFEAAVKESRRENGACTRTKPTPLSDVLLSYLLDHELMKERKVISGRLAANSSVLITPRILTLGGDHTTTLSALRSTYQKWGPVSVIHFDSHIDTWDPLVLGGGISDYAGLNHGTFLHIAHEENLILNTSIHAGIRAPLIRRKGDLRNDVRCGFEIVTARDLDKLGAKGVISKLKERVGDSRVYISVDIDVLDPAFAPATGTAEPGGWSTRELLTILDGLEGLSIVGADVVEVAPAYDNNGETTVLAAAEIAYSLIDLMVLKPVQ
ncbi:proclavaminate amidinohydrolase [Colletotrichum paranaense]|uniref:Proclavaminate amidinohydrolase n=1 Tax=Colletotrichum paranaense TaxID=1914294 RepID=A0ABQ9T4L2_9PEZI|nr:proclavaminate amidinohydrolase [Colletotrichum paranaense]KAK1546717.1 proclavaminate amidinohydrolase [Colletotrichum paranaense]